MTGAIKVGVLGVPRPDWSMKLRQLYIKRRIRKGIDPAEAVDAIVNNASVLALVHEEVAEGEAAVREAIARGQLDGLWDASRWTPRPAPVDSRLYKGEPIHIHIMTAEEVAERKAEQRRVLELEWEDEQRQWEASQGGREAALAAEKLRLEQPRLHRAWTAICQVFMELNTGIVGYVVGVPPQIVARGDPANDLYQDGVEAKFIMAGFYKGEVNVMHPIGYNSIQGDYAALASDLAQEAGGQIIFHDKTTYAATVIGPNSAPYAGFFRVAVIAKIERGEHLEEE